MDFRLNAIEIMILIMEVHILVIHLFNKDPLSSNKMVLSKYMTKLWIKQLISILFSLPFASLKVKTKRTSDVYVGFHCKVQLKSSV